MIHFFAAVHRIPSFLGQASTHLLGMRRVIGFHAAADPKLEQWARDVLRELKERPIVQPGSDLAEAVLERLRCTDEDACSHPRETAVDRD